MLVPRAGGTISVHDLDETHPALNEAPRREELLTEGARLVLVESVEVFVASLSFEKSIVSGTAICMR